MFLRLANLFHKFVDKMTLHVLYFPLHEKRITKKIPSGGGDRGGNRLRMGQFSKVL